MSITLLVILAFSLALDAFAVSISNGMCYRVPVVKNALASGVTFGFFQGLMPLLGYMAGNAFSGLIESIDHWIALILLCAIGGKMIHDVIQERRATGDHCKIQLQEHRAFSYKLLFVQGIATSIDALIVGVGLGIMQVNLWVFITLVAVITFCCSFAGVVIGKSVGIVLKDKAEILGGIMLILIGIRIFAEHMGIF